MQNRSGLLLNVNENDHDQTFTDRSQRDKKSKVAVLAAESGETNQN